MTRAAYDAMMEAASKTVQAAGKRAIAESYDHPTRNPPQNPVAEHPVRNDPLAAPQRESSHKGRIHVSIESRRKRLLDPDNICPKFHIDLLRYSKLIPDDRPEDIELKVSQTKIGKGEQEETVITVEYPQEDAHQS